MGISSLVWATDIDVLPLDRVVERRDGYLVVRSPSNPDHWWGNWLLFDDPPAAGDGIRWERRFEAEFGGERPLAHRAFGWDRVVMLLAGTASIRDVIAFPKAASGLDPLTGAPTPITPEQRREAGIDAPPTPASPPPLA